MGDYTRPKYQDGYEIRYNRDTDQFECWQNERLLPKKNGSPASYKALGLAIKFMAASGAKEVTPEPKKPAWTRPEPVEILPLEEQLTALPDTRFVVVEKHISIYKERGYGVWDREEQEIVCPHTYNGINFLSRLREDAEKEAEYRKDHPPMKKIEPDENLLNILAEAEEAWTHRFSQPLPEPTPPPAEKELIFVTQDKHSIGDIIVDEYERRYEVVKPSYWLSEREVADLEDQDIFNVRPGWQTETKLVE